MIRRLRDKSLDPNRIPQYTTLSTQARVNYTEVLKGLYIALRNPNYQREVHNILTQLLRLKQICADDKVDFTVDLAETALDETSEMPWNKVLIFSQFKATQHEIAKRIGNRARVINGDVTDKQRYELVDKFQDINSDVKVIVTNITEGLTLTNAFTVIINDLWWTPKDHVQAEGRAFGRENDPHGGNSYYVLCEDSIDDMIWMLLEKKLAIFKEMIDNVYNKNEEENSMFQQLMTLFKRMS
jgi:SNF2 family DNA or RNA helicase